MNKRKKNIKKKFHIESFNCDEYCIDQLSFLNMKEENMNKYRSVSRESLRTFDNLRNLEMNDYGAYDDGPTFYI